MTTLRSRNAVGGSRGRGQTHTWLICVVLPQKPTQLCKAIILQVKKIKKKKEKNKQIFLPSNKKRICIESGSYRSNSQTEAFYKMLHFLSFVNLYLNLIF